MSRITAEDQLIRHLSKPTPTFRLTVTETVTRVYELEAESEKYVAMTARLHDANRHSIPKSVTVIDNQINIEAIE